MSPDHTAPRRRPSGDGSLRRVLEPRLGIDPRALAAFRVALALVVLVDLLVLRAPELVTFYTDEGVVPRSLLAETYPTLSRLSIHALSGAAWVQVVLFAVAGAFAVLLLVGYRTRLATAVSLVLLASLLARNPELANGGDTILLTFLFLGLFLPLGARWSLDARSDADRDRRRCSLATATLLVHFTVVYATNAAFKLQSEPWMDGVAVPRIFNLEQYLALLGPTVAELSTALVAVNWLWVALLSVAVLLPVLTGRARVALVAAFVAAHLGMAATMRLGVFPFVMIAGLLPFLPPDVWDRLERRAARLRPVTGRERRPLTRLRSAVGGARPAFLPSIVAASPRATDAPALPPRARRGARTVGTVVVACFLAASLLWQGAAVAVETDAVDPADVPGDAAAQSWAFFAPNPPDAHAWHAAEATLASGETVGPYDGDPGLDRPPDAGELYPSTLWKRYGTALASADESRYESIAAFHCDRASASVAAVTVYHVDRPVGPDGPTDEPTAAERIEYAC